MGVLIYIPINISKVIAKLGRVVLCIMPETFTFIQFSFRIDYFPIAHNTLCLPPKFCITYCLKMLLGKCNTPRSILKQWFMQNLGGKQSVLWAIGK